MDQGGRSLTSLQQNTHSTESRIGRVLHFDNPSTSQGIKDYLRAKVIIPIDHPPVPGFYFVSENHEPDWVDFCYEGVFVYCTKCGRIWHRRPRCRFSFETSQRHFETVMNDIGQGVGQPLISPTFQPLFTNKLIGLKRVQRNRITQVNLVDYSWERDEEGDILSENSHSQNEDNQENESNTSHHNKNVSL